MSDTTNKKELRTCKLLLNGIVNSISKRQLNQHKIPFEKSWEFAELKRTAQIIILKIEKIIEDQ